MTALPVSSRAFMIAAALVMGLSAATAGKASAAKFEGVVLVPPAQSETRSPQFKRGQIVDFQTRQKPGSIVIVTRDKALYYILGNGKAVKYRVATAKRGFEWRGTNQVSAKVKWPDWRPPATMRKRRPDLPVHMAGGPENPLGARAIYLGSTIYRIHGTNEPSSIGKAASSGCIRMLNADVAELFRHVKLGATVTVV
ncbi:L,D-transpeptidase [Taklimakanibacter lacteus]|uniref:L,D-transpeptidase n=1 Tax=Taklimakanibacter lacteus TaxID=2268456 RepID=UPI0034D7585B